MSTLKFKGSSSGEVSLTVPATVANQTINLPAAAPIAGQSLKATDTSGTLGWQGSYNFDVAITIPGDALAGTTGTFTMTADSANSDTTAIVAEKQRLRDITEDVDAMTTEAQLKAKLKELENE